MVILKACSRIAASVADRGLEHNHMGLGLLSTSPQLAIARSLVLQRGHYGDVRRLSCSRSRGGISRSRHAVVCEFCVLLPRPRPRRRCSVSVPAHQFVGRAGRICKRKYGLGVVSFAALSSFASGEEGETAGQGLEDVVEDFESISSEEAQVFMHSGSSSSKLGAASNGASSAHMKMAGEADATGGMQGMAEAFNISSRTAVGITGSIAVAAFVVPIFLQSSAAGLTLKTRVLSYATLLFGFYMAWNIGANDVANAMGTSVGSGALTLRQAVLTAAVLEFSGAFLVGSHVSHTMQSGILVADVFKGRDSMLFSGMLASLAAAGTWLQVASFYGWPVSTTHCIIGAMVGFGIVYGGIGAVYWTSLARVVSSWVVSPLMGAAVSFVVYKCIRVFVYRAPNPGQAAAKAAPLAVFVGITALSFTTLHGSGDPLIAVAKALAFGLLGAAAISTVINQQVGQLLGDYCELPSPSDEQENKNLRRLSLNLLAKVGGPTGTQLRIVYSIFGYLQVLSACFMSFAHGANDVANAIGPISAALAILHGSSGQVGMSTEVLAWGGFGIVAGLLVWGYRVIATIGNKITELTPTRGFAAEFAAATVVVVASRLGLPISATHTLVGAVMGVGFARGLNSVRGEVVREIAASWLVTVPVGAILSVMYASVLVRLIPSLV